MFYFIAGTLMILKINKPNSLYLLYLKRKRISAELPIDIVLPRLIQP